MAGIKEHISEENLASAIAQVEALARPADDAYYPEVLARWRHVRLDEGNSYLYLAKPYFFVTK